MALVVFLRGVNVGGHKTFRPSLIAGQLKDYDVVNVGAAGTFVVRKRISPSQLHSEVLRRLPFEAEVIICDGRDLVNIGESDPFALEPSSKDIVRFVTVLAKRPKVHPTVPLRFPPDGRWLLRILAIQDRFVFGLYRREMKAIRYLSAVDKLFGMPVTTRNWNTITAIIKVLRGDPRDLR